MTQTAAIFGPAALEVTAWERGFFRDADPWGFILFARNIDTPDQLRRLTGDLRDVLGRAAPILIDQEGGRVQRMRSPLWRDYLPALDQMARASDPLRAQWLRYRLIARDLLSVGIDVNCAPLADVAEDATHPFLQNRLYGWDVPTVVAAARACADGLLAGGVLPVLKHIPGHGRAQADSHLALPRVSASVDDLTAHDFAPFAALRDLPLGMTAHIVFDALDPDRPATTSPVMMQVIRDQIGFDGLLMTDDLSMQALAGTVTDRSLAAVGAGCDLILHCNGDAQEMADVAKAAGALSPQAIIRADRALALRKPPEKIDIAALEAEFEALMA
ncbi:glycoside hydrolase family 3 N-terminal domain-containing protein [Yoonia vestfoldensis]|uniref:glycoside hydrolase family 3 N-terminal domain-containing protein n=1 Tax=Yoonia vestfoldensis TaxID=245188 RepID=UPI00037ECB10|nr:glycoside hydrolase family 3 N-terminal domain-containing protein [Yoonia vestfoldensis]